MTPIMVAVVAGLSAGIGIAFLWAVVCQVLITSLAPVHDPLQVPIFAISAVATALCVLFKGS